jgi:F0F1-type ATP synthase assembly protein I
MNKTKAQKVKPSPETSNKAKKYEKYANASGMFFGFALDMSWKLLISFLVPILIGSFLDNKYKRFNSTFVLVGLLVALILSTVVTYTTIKEANSLTKNIKLKKEDNV